MGFVMIKGQPVYLTSERMGKLRSAALADKPGKYRVLSMIGNTKINKEAWNLLRRCLLAEQKKDPERFIDEWVCFSLSGEEAQNEITELLRAYCFYHGCAGLHRYSDGISQVIFEDFMGTSFSYPFGKQFWFAHLLRPYSLRWRIITRTKERKIRILIDATKVRRISGSLDWFTVSCDGFYMQCGKDVSILPKGGGIKRSGNTS